MTITLPAGRADLAVEANGAVYGAGDTFQITLNEFEVYQAQSVGDLTGTRVQSTVRAAVFAGNVRTKIELSGSRDHLVQQMLPTSTSFIFAFSESFLSAHISTCPTMRFFWSDDHNLKTRINKI